MAVIKDYRCNQCEKVEEAWSDAIPECHGQVMSWNPTPTKNFEWGGPRQYLHLRDEPFSSRAELNRYTRDKKLSLGVSSEKVRGGRNDMYDGIGKSYSYAGASGRDNPLANLPRRN